MAFPRILPAAGVLIAALAVIGCGGGNSYGSSPASATPARPSPSASTSPANSGNKRPLTIVAKDYAFSADTVNVSKGDVVAITFTNSGSTTHTLAFYSDAAYQTPIAGADTGSVSGGATAALTVTVGDGLYYRCNIHPTQMHGEIAIATTPASSQPQPGTPTPDARSAPADTPTRSPGASIDGQPSAPANSAAPTQAASDSQLPAPTSTAAPTQAPALAPTAAPTIAPSSTRAAPTGPSKPYVPPSYNY